MATDQQRMSGFNFKDFKSANKGNAAPASKPQPAAQEEESGGSGYSERIKEDDAEDDIMDESEERGGVVRDPSPKPA